MTKFHQKAVKKLSENAYSFKHATEEKSISLKSRYTKKNTNIIEVFETLAHFEKIYARPHWSASKTFDAFVQMPPTSLFDVWKQIFVKWHKNYSMKCILTKFLPFSALRKI